MHPLESSDPHPNGQTASEDQQKTRTMRDRYNTESYVAIYDARYRRLQREKWGAIMANGRGWLRLATSILDFGCGTGLTWEMAQGARLDGSVKNEELADPSIRPMQNDLGVPPPISGRGLLPDGAHYIGCDIAIEMLRQFSVKVGHTATGPKSTSGRVMGAHLVCCDGEHLPFRNGCFEAVLSLTTLQNLASPARGLREIARTAQKGAPSLVAASVLRKSGPAEKWLDLFRHAFPAPPHKVWLAKESAAGDLEDWVFLVHTE